jgi:SprT-like family protein
MVTREEWLITLMNRLRPEFTAHSVALPDEIAVSCGWTSKGARGKRIGECWRADCSHARRPEIFISPKLADSIEVGHVLVHELIHAALPDAGHGSAFKRVALRLGLTGRMTATVPTDALRQRLGDLIEHIGEPYPHAELRPGEDERKQSTRLLKLSCPGCGYVIRTTQKWIEVGVPTCCCGEDFVPE